LLFEGTMRGIFSILFGAGVILFTARSEQKGGGLEVADTYYRRTLWLLLFGIIHAYILLWPFEILYQYGLAGLFLFPFRNTKPKKLILASVVLILIGFAFGYKGYHHFTTIKAKAVVAQSLVDKEEEIDQEQQAAIDKYKKRIQNFKPSEEAITEVNNNMRAGYWDILLTLAPINERIQSKMTYRMILWDVLAMMLLGMALFKLKFLTAERSIKFYGLVAFLGYAIGISINYYETQLIVSSGFMMTGFYEAFLTYPFGRFFTVFGHLGLIIIFCKINILGWLKRALAAVGRMAFSNYILQTVICNIIFLGFGFALFGYLQRYELYYVVFSIWIFEMIFSTVWLHYFKFGPLEWLWRSLTYQRMQPMRRKHTVPSPVNAM